MNLAALSIKRPIFITCITIVLLVVGVSSMLKMGVDLFPNVEFPIVFVNTQYPGAGPTEVENLVSRVLEDEISGLPGIKNLRSVSREGFSFVIIEFQLKTDLKFNMQQVRDRVSSARGKLPTDIREPVVRNFNPDDQPVLVVSVQADLPDGRLYDLAKETVKTRIEQVPSVGQVDVLGARKREIRVELDRNRLRDTDISAVMVSRQIESVGKNIPIGKTANAKNQTVYRTVAEFKSVDDIANTVVRFTGNEFPVSVRDLGTVVDDLQDETTRTYVKGKRALLLNVYRQSGANTISVVDAVNAAIVKLNEDVSKEPGGPKVEVVQDSSKAIRANVADVEESILIGIVLTILVVWFFLGSLRATFITGLALPTSLLGAFLLMSLAGFSINIMSLLALSLSVGLLIDDAIVVRENIFRHIEMGHSAKEASLLGTNQVALAVVATTSTVLAVFGPIGFLDGVVGQFFKEFGLTVCFAMAISLMDAMTIAPMLSAYMMGSIHDDTPTRNPVKLFLRSIQRASDRIQILFDRAYARILGFSVSRPWVVLAIAVALFAGSLWLTKYVSKTFLPAQDTGEFEVGLDLPSGTSLGRMNEVATLVDVLVRSNAEVKNTVLTVGNANGEVNRATVAVALVHRRERKMNTSDFKDILRKQIRSNYAFARPSVRERDMFGGGQRPFVIRIAGDDFTALEAYAAKLLTKAKEHPALKDPDVNFRPGNPEFQVVIDKQRAQGLGVASDVVGAELRTQVEGTVPAVYRENGREYDIRVRMKEDQRNLRTSFYDIRVPNLNGSLVPLASLASPVDAVGRSSINRENRGRYVVIGSDIAPKGPGMGGAISDLTRLMDGKAENGAYKVPEGMTFKFVGQAENFKELGANMLLALILGVLFIYLVLASLYESFITPFTIMLVLPLALCGAFIALWATGFSLDIFSMIGCIMLMGVATKNSILLVDRANQLLAEGKTRFESIMESGKTRLRPILMTSFALVAGMVPIAIGLNEASSQRRSMGIALIGGLISSTILSLLVIPAVWSYIDRFREWSGKKLKRLSGV